MSTLLFIPDETSVVAGGERGHEETRLAPEAVLPVPVNVVRGTQVERAHDPAVWTALLRGHQVAAVLLPPALSDSAAKAVRALAFAAFTGRLARFVIVLGDSVDDQRWFGGHREAHDFIGILDMPKEVVRREQVPAAGRAGRMLPSVQGRA